MGLINTTRKCNSQSIKNTRTNPKLSAYSYIFRQFNFMSTPLALPGTKVIAYRKLQKRGSWELNGEIGWYAGLSLNYYYFVTVYFPRIREERNCNMVEFIPNEVLFLRVLLDEFLK